MDKNLNFSETAPQHSPSNSCEGEVGSDLSVNVDNENRSELLDKFKKSLAERNELRRRNMFLQKKMVEFFKKRKMDHVLKEDKKGKN